MTAAEQHIRPAAGQGRYCPANARAPRAEVPPCDYLSASGVWPDGPFVADTPREAFLAVGVTQRLRELCNEQSERGRVTAVAERANLSTQTVFNLLQGSTWGDLPTIYRLEVVLGAVLQTNFDRGRRPPN